MPSSHSFDSSVRTRPDTLALDSSIPEETAVEIADTSYAPVLSPDEPAERPVAKETSQQGLNGEMNEWRAPVINGDTDTISAAAQCENDLLPNGKGVQQRASSAGSKPSSMSRFKSVLIAVAAILVCTLIGAIVMFEFEGTSLHLVPGLNHFHRKVYRPLRTAVGRSLPS